MLIDCFICLHVAEYEEIIKVEGIAEVILLY